MYQKNRMEQYKQSSTLVSILQKIKPLSTDKRPIIVLQSNLICQNSNLLDLAQHLGLRTRPVAGFHRASPSTSLDKSKMYCFVFELLYHEIYAMSRKIDVFPPDCIIEKTHKRHSQSLIRGADISWFYACKINVPMVYLC